MVNDVIGTYSLLCCWKISSSEYAPLQDVMRDIGELHRDAAVDSYAYRHLVKRRQLRRIICRVGVEASYQIFYVLRIALHTLLKHVRQVVFC